MNENKKLVPVVLLIVFDIKKNVCWDKAKIFNIIIKKRPVSLKECPF